MPNLNKENILKIAEVSLFERNLAFDREEGLKVRFEWEKTLREGEVLPVWTITYLTEKNPYFDQDMHFMLINDMNGEVLYIITPTSYIE